MSAAPKGIHARRAWHAERARRFADSANSAMGRLWREVGALRDAWGEPHETGAPDRMELLMRDVAAEWRKKISDEGWEGVWPPREFETLRKSP